MLSNEPQNLEELCRSTIYKRSKVNYYLNLSNHQKQASNTSSLHSISTHQAQAAHWRSYAQVHNSSRMLMRHFARTQDAKTIKDKGVNLAGNIWAAKRQCRAAICTYARSLGHTQPQTHLGTAVIHHGASPNIHMWVQERC